MLRPQAGTGRGDRGLALASGSRHAADPHDQAAMALRKAIDPVSEQGGKVVGNKGVLGG